MAAKKKFNAATYAYSECREHHDWKPYDGTIDDKAKLAYRIQKCPNCSTKKHSVLSMRPANFGQHFKSPTYSYPDDYQVAGGLDRADRGQIRMHNFLEELGHSS